LESKGDHREEKIASPLFEEKKREGVVFVAELGKKNAVLFRGQKKRRGLKRQKRRGGRWKRAQTPEKKGEKGGLVDITGEGGAD